MSINVLVIPEDWTWTEFRGDCDPKERFYLPYARLKGLDKAPYEGREPLARQAAAPLRIRQLCPQDVARLEQRIRDAVLSTSKIGRH